MPVGVVSEVGVVVVVAVVAGSAVGVSADG
jgi:hypothetical protein